jgi:tetratricopeptide (TPR) repeat protein
MKSLVEVRRDTRGFVAGALLAALPLLPGPAGGQEAPSGQAPPDSLRDLERMVAADSSYDHMYRLGVAYLDRDRAFEATQLFRRCTERKPKDPKAWVNLGAAQDALGHGAEARAAYRQAIAVHPDDEIALCRLSASLYAAAGEQRPAAMDTLRLILKRHPKSYCGYFTLGVAFADAQMYREAVRAWEKVTEFGPGTPEAKAAQESINSLVQILQGP